jgi:DNA-binding LacI/PurR family transcriptional regulator
VQLAVSRQIPVALVLPDVVGPGVILRADNLRGGVLAGEHLLALGHRRVAFLGGPEDSRDTQDRLQGLRAALSPQVELPDELVRFGVDYEFESGRRLAREFLRSEGLRRCTAVVLGNDALSLGFLREVRSAGVRVPEELSVMGFDGIPLGELSSPSLTTVAQPVERMGRDVASCLLFGAPAPDPYQLELVVRESTRPPP